MSLINDTYTLDTIQFIGGTKTYLNFTVNKSDGTPLSLNGGTISWKMRNQGNFGGSAVIIKNMVDIVITGTNTFQVILNSTDTLNLFGKFVHQPIITDIGGNTFRPAQGYIVIDKAIV